MRNAQEKDASGQQVPPRLWLAPPAPSIPSKRQPWSFCDGGVCEAGLVRERMPASFLHPKSKPSTCVSVRVKGGEEEQYSLNFYLFSPKTCWDTPKGACDQPQPPNTHPYGQQP